MEVEKQLFLRFCLVILLPDEGELLLNDQKLIIVMLLI